MASALPDLERKDYLVLANGPAHSLGYSASIHIKPKPYVRIVEQPADIRFRYESEGKWAGSISGVNSKPSNKNFPTIEVVGYRGKAYVIVSCVTENAPYKPHPHNLVGREGCKDGVCKMLIPEETMSMTFSNLGIRCTKKMDFKESLRIREKIGVDPFHTGFSHAAQPNSIKIKCVRLCFQVYIEENGTTVLLPPVVSNPVYDKKDKGDLVISKLSHCVSPVNGTQHDILLFCEKVEKDNIQIRFYEEIENELVWEDFGLFQPSDIHHLFAISFKAPPYKNLMITDHVKVFLQLRRPSDGAVSEPLAFEYHPADLLFLDSKRSKRFKPNTSLLDKLKQYQNSTTLPSASNASTNESFKPDYIPNIPLISQPLLSNPYSQERHMSGLDQSTLLPDFDNIFLPSQNLPKDENKILNDCDSASSHRQSNFFSLMDMDVGESNLRNFDLNLVEPTIPFNNLLITNNGEVPTNGNSPENFLMLGNEHIGTFF